MSQAAHSIKPRLLKGAGQGVRPGKTLCRLLVDFFRPNELIKTQQRTARSGVSLSKIIRGLRLTASLPALNKDTAEDDARYVDQVCTRALGHHGHPKQRVGGSSASFLLAAAIKSTSLD